jgi:hypothetical protein
MNTPTAIVLVAAIAAAAAIAIFVSPELGVMVAVCAYVVFAPN